MSLADVAHLVVGPDDHGVVRHGLAVAAAARQPVVRISAPAADVALAPTIRLLHLHFTDKLFGSTPPVAAAACRGLLDRLNRPAVVGLHDVPHGDRAEIDRGRVACYRSVAEAAAAVVVSCPTERNRVRSSGVTTPVHVVPLPIALSGSARPPGRVDRRLALLGFVYPDKGHAEAIDAASRCGIGVVALGRCSDGHGDLAAHLDALATDRGTTIEITGFLPDDELLRRARSVAVPFVGAARTSASASLRTWIGAGRRPVVVANGHTKATAGQLGDLLTLCDGTAAGIATAVRTALSDPASTWTHTDVPVSCSMAGVAAATMAIQLSVVVGGPA